VTRSKRGDPPGQAVDQRQSPTRPRVGSPPAESAGESPAPSARVRKLQKRVDQLQPPAAIDNSAQPPAVPAAKQVSFAGPQVPDAEIVKEVAVRAPEPGLSMQLQHFPTQSFMSHPTIQNQAAPAFFPASNQQIMQWLPPPMPYVQFPGGSMQNMSWGNYGPPSGTQPQLAPATYAIPPLQGPQPAALQVAPRRNTPASLIKPLQV
jgi:hypothetical protein